MIEWGACGSFGGIQRKRRGSIMKIAIMGSGGIGGYFGAQLAAKTDNDVWFIARGDHLRAIRQNGLHIES